MRRNSSATSPWLRCTWAVAAVAALAACAGEPQPTTQMSLAQQAISEAVNNGAQQRAPADLETAQQKLAMAQSSARNGYSVDARRFAEEAQIDAQLASVTSRTAAATANLNQLQGRTTPPQQEQQ
jgi:hypothetical protein